jgi:tetratricopeptide (TPR) repeat protein
MKKIVTLILFSFIFFSAVLHAQMTPAIDSLKRGIALSKSDSGKVEMMIQLAARLKSRPDTALIVARQAKNLAIELGLFKKEARAIKLMGDLLMVKKQFDAALDKYQEAGSLYDKLNDPKEKANTLCNIGVCYYNKSDYAKALDYNFQALKIYETIKHEAGKAIALGNIGLVHMMNGKPEKSLEYAQKAYQIDLNLGNSEGVCRHLSNIATIYQHQGSALNQTDTLAANGKYRKALKAYDEAMRIAEKNGSRAQIAMILDNQANVYFEMGDTSRCLEYFSKAYDIDKSIGNKEGMSMHVGNIGWIHFTSNRLKEAERYTKEAIDLLEQSTDVFYKSNFNENLSEIYEKLGKYDLALEKYRLAIKLRDSLFNIESARKQLESEMNFEFEKKEAIAKEETARQTLIRNVLIAGFGLMFALVIVVFRGYRAKKKANEIISLQKSEMEKQKLIVEHKNKEITDSIQYAKRIQKSLMPNEKYIERTLKGERRNGSS